MRITLTSLREKITYFILFLMPFHVLIFNVMDIKVLSLWRDALIFLLLATTLLAPNRIIGKDKLRTALATRTLICVIFAILLHDSTMSAGIWVNVLRIYIIPAMIVFPLARMCRSERFVKKSCQIYISTAVAISIFGIVQMFLIGRPFLQLMGVGHGSVFLTDGTQRNIGVFESANVMAMFVLIAMIICSEIDGLYEARKTRIIILGILLISLVLTFSMSAIGALGIIILYKIIKKKKRAISRKKVIQVLVGLMLFGVVGLIVILSSPALYEFVQVQLSEKIWDILDTLAGTNQNTSTSAAIHFDSLTSGFELVWENLNGLGFAKESYMVSDKVFNRPLIGAKESSILTILYDFGVLVGILYLIPYFIGTFYSGKYRRSARLRPDMDRSRKYIGVVILVSYIFLPLIQSYELTFFTFYFMAIFYYYPMSNHSGASLDTKAG